MSSMLVTGLPQYKIVVHASLPCPICRSHRSHSLGFFPTYATNIPKYLVWLHTWSSISSAGVTRCLSIYRSLQPWQSGAVYSHRRKLAQSASVTLRQWTTL